MTRRRIKWSTLALVIVALLVAWFAVSLVLGYSTGGPSDTGIIHKPA